MKAFERVRQRMIEDLKAGVLSPGARLPSYRDLAEQEGISYLTARAVMQKLEREHLVEIRSSGCFVAGGTPLKVLFQIGESTISHETMRNLLKKHLAPLDLNLEIRVLDWTESAAEMNRHPLFLKEFDAVFTITGYSQSVKLFPSVTLNDFGEYEEIIQDLRDFSEIQMVDQLPFSLFTYQMGINRGLMRQIGFDPGEITSDFKWWKTYTEKCEQHHLFPAVHLWTPDSLIFLSKMICPMLALLPYSPDRYWNGKPLFTTSAGLRFLELVRDIQFLSPEQKDQTFLRGNVPFDFNVGSWITVQNPDRSRPDVDVHELEIVPYRDSNGKKICFYTIDCLGLHFPKPIQAAAKSRILKFLKMLFSRDFQKEYCGLTGAVSIRKDILPTEYYWNRSLNWNSFIPDENCIADFPFIHFSPHQQTAWSIYMEELKRGVFSLEETAERMDLKRKYSIYKQ